ncbi:pentatricopeptide repeat-containing protein At5g61370, mitochondrial [Phoenix dactylifera]|uniref:Pentatricopeptide repeat-containing protein At5g61370, mitochondrial n=1 Tax=Phoenix dactylifera TaxID=42345 RepID=A0A8B8ZLB3_PHODC|nr:pentatricopeptide repeat-containing protein At5g61370, mitochondrial [Phoenix dactylifera]XP_038972435.1 pentatricopeptide repeat-containing protein At5g61370, mitochondrial [Phoenix dactylifera]XP_038972436.1 pentatricopeptide repeat-containing protein At5g61370, mitochondrial [Phoenix dactylifera]XP_038972437.1 pentatricopeptide repeat-containing protein At5g61370, mitochondrial [Phoenix dactylifera]
MIMAAATRLRLLGRPRFTRQCHQQPARVQSLLDVISTGVGGLDDMEASLNRLGVAVAPSLVTQVVDSYTSSGGGGGGGGRRLLRFFSWCRRRSRERLGDEVFDHAIRAFAGMKDLTAMEITISDLEEEGRKMTLETFVLVTETLVRSGREDEAVRLFRSMESKQLLPPSCIPSIVHALCARGHARKARGIVWHHRDELQAAPAAIAADIHRSLLHGWCVHGNAREARRAMDEMRSLGIRPGLASYNSLLRCICQRNLRFNPSALVPEAADLMSEMRASGVSPTTVSFNILLSCLGRARRVKEAYRILHSMRQLGESGCAPDWMSYYILVRVLYLTGRYVRGNRLVDQMLEERLSPGARFYRGLVGVLCGVERMDHALKVFERMKRCCEQDQGPTYDLLIEKLCRNGRFDAGRRLWEEAAERGIILQCSKDLLDPSKTEVFKPRESAVKLSPRDYKRAVQKRKKDWRLTIQCKYAMRSQNTKHELGSGKCRKCRPIKRLRCDVLQRRRPNQLHCSPLEIYV